MAEEAKSFYHLVLEEVIEKNRREFMNEGISENVLENLKKTWLQKVEEKLS
jgi:hypothetical protein